MMTLDRIILAAVAAAGLGSAGLSVHVKATMATTEQRLALLEKEDVALEEKLKLEQSYRRAVLARLDALCRATPRANCPLGENER